jgi:SAM-dependent methyltransferase
VSVASASGQTQLCRAATKTGTVVKGDKKGFSEERLRRLEAIEGWHFWFHGRRILVDELIGRERIDRHPLHLELACGTGRIAAEMSRRGHRVVAVDLLPEALELARRADPQAMLVRCDATHLPFRPGTFDIVTALEVLEHVDDEAALTELRFVLRPTGRAIISVPAMPWLWSARDVDAGHLRRYTPTLLRTTLNRARLVVVGLRYYQTVLFPLVVISRLLGKGAQGLRARDREEINVPVLNRVLGWVNEVEAMVSTRVALPWGSSLFVVCRPLLVLASLAGLSQ